MAESVPDSSFGAEHGQFSGSSLAQDPVRGSHASQSSSSDVESGAQSQAQMAMSSNSRDEQASAMAERTAVRALMAQASILKRLGRLPDALQALNLAAVLDRGVEVHAQKLQAEMRDPMQKEALDGKTEP